MLSRQRNALSWSPGIQPKLMESVSHCLCRNALSSSVPELDIQGRSVMKPLTSRLNQQKYGLDVKLQSCRVLCHVCVKDLCGLDDDSTFGISHSDTLRIPATRRWKTPDSNFPTPRFISSGLKQFLSCL